MATTWGAIESHLKVGINITMSPTSVTSSTTSVTLTIKKYVGNDSLGWDWDDTQTMTHGGAITGSTTFTCSLGPTENDYQLVITQTLKVTLTGSTQSKSFSGTISGAYNGATPTHSRSFTVPAKPAPPVTVPSAPAAPAVNSVDYSGAYLTAEEPDAGTSSILEFQQQTATSTAFTTIVSDTLFPTAGLFRVSNCAPSTLYYTRVRARNTSGWSSYSPVGGAPFTTSATPTGNSFYTKVDGVWRLVAEDFTKANRSWDDVSNPQVKVASAWDT